ncbi:MAG TPA: hypothetical protein VEL28_22885 [Candidatus Binatia bacterium]|nr:hypothetical protein [Candidatus Binatia bacterium]
MGIKPFAFRLSLLLAVTYPPSSFASSGGENLTCYEIEDALASHKPTWRELAPGDAAGCRMRTDATLLCMRDAAPSARGDDVGRDQLCYRVRCAGEPAAEPLWLDDLAGGRVVRRGATTFLCTPASTPGGQADADEDSDPAHSAGALARALAVILRECGDFSGEGTISASDALGTLRSAVGSASCLPCVCDVDSSGTFTASDALRVLRNAVGQPVDLNCSPDGNPVSWTGAADNVSWHLAGNWSTAPRIPNLCDDVTIAGTGPAIVHSQGTNGALRINSSRSIDLTGGSLQTRDTVFVGGTLRFVGGTLKDSIVLAAEASAEGNAAGGGDTHVVFTNSGGVVDNVTFEADIDMTSTSSNIRIMNDLMLEGAASLGSATTVRFQGGDQLLGGSGEILFNNAAGKTIVVDAGTMLTIGPDMTIHGAAGTVGSAGELINQGLIHASGGGKILVNSTAGGWANDGMISGSGGGDLELTGIWVNNSQVEITESGILTLSGTWENNGTITSDNAIVNLDGTFTLADLGTLVRTGGEVNVTGTFDNDTDLLLDAQTGNWRLVGGTILGGTVSAQDGTELVATNSGGLLDAVMLLSDLNMTSTSANVRVSNGLELGPDAVVSMGSAANFRFQGGNQMLTGEGEIFFQGLNGKSITIDSGTTVDIGAGITVRGATGAVGSTGSFTNNGLIHSDLPGEILVTSTQGWTNESTIQGSGGGDVELAGMWTNNGNVSIADSGTLTLSGTWTNAGAIDAMAATVNLGGTFTLASLGDFSRSGGEVNITGTFNNVADLTLDSVTGDWILRGGTILGGRVDGIDGAELVLSNSGGLLDGVEVAGGVDMTATSANVRVQNGIELDGTITMGSAANMRFQGGQQMLSGEGEVVFQGASNKSITVDSGTTLTIGQDVTIGGDAGTVGSNGMIVNEGLIDANVAGEILVTSTQGWTNNGEIRARDGGDVQLSGIWNNTALVAVEDGATLTLDGDWTNTGKLVADGSTVNLGGTFTLVDLGSFDRTGGSVNITGTFDNETNLLLDLDTGSWRLVGGTILGGSVGATGGAELVLTNSGGLLDGVTMDAPLNMTATSANVRVQNDLVLNDTATMSSAANMRFQGGQQTLEGAGEIVFQGASNKSVTVDSGGKLTIAESMTIRGGQGTVGSAGMLEIHGTIDSTDGNEITITSTQGWDNQGTLRASAGNLRTTGTGSHSAGTIEIAAGRTLAAAGGFTHGAASTLTLHIASAASFGKVTVTGAANLAGTLTIDLADAFDPPLGTMFQIMTFGSRVGDFTTVNGLAIGNGKKLQRTSTATAMTLEVVAE